MKVNIPRINRVRALYRCDQCGYMFLGTVRMYQHSPYSAKCTPDPREEMMCPRSYSEQQTECYGYGQLVSVGGNNA